MVAKILNDLPPTIEWMVMFRISAIQRFADNTTIKKMYFLNENTEIEQYDFVVLTSEGRFLYNNQNTSFTNGESLHPVKFNTHGLSDVYKDEIGSLNIDLADSFATGYYPEYGKVILYITFDKTVAIAQSVFNKAPNTDYYEFLQAVGVKFIKGEYLANGKYLAHYENTLSKHIASGILANFSRTDNCNLFFFLHGNINDELAKGIIHAGWKRLEYEQKHLQSKLELLANKCMQENLKMQVIQPFTEDTFDMGDVVPKGILYGALAMILPNERVTLNLHDSLYKDKLRGLWTFEKNDLETSVDTALILQFMYDNEATQLLQKFQDPKSGGFLPQTDAEVPKEGDMKYVPEKDHWCQANIASSALIAYIYHKHQINIDTQLEHFILSNFDNRSDLYFANPYFVDWLYAKSLTALSNTNSLKDRLKNEILSSINFDFSLGAFDKVFSTACGILALKELGASDNQLLALQLFVLNNYQTPGEQQPIPFYSSLLLHETHSVKTGNIVSIKDKNLSVYLYKDQHSVIYTAIVGLSLSIDTKNASNQNKGIKDYVSANSPSRYVCKNHLEYIAQFALPPYLQ
jgi:hypothetical protein